MGKSSLDHETEQTVATNANVPITTEPKATSMDMSRGSSDDTDTIETYEDNSSGNQNNSNECTEFCLDLFTCFGAFDVCCPSTGEGCLSNTAAFFGNICVGFLKC